MCIIAMNDEVTMTMENDNGSLRLFRTYCWTDVFRQNIEVARYLQEIQLLRHENVGYQLC